MRLHMHCTHTHTHMPGRAGVRDRAQIESAAENWAMCSASWCHRSALTSTPRRHVCASVFSSPCSQKRALPIDLLKIYQQNLFDKRALTALLYRRGDTQRFLNDEPTGR